ncbi:MAG: DUF29 domain-containing protein [Cyanobacteria bacterium J06629_2]
MDSNNKIAHYDIDLDYDLWLQEQADKLRSHSFTDLDIDNLVEELESLVRGEKSAVESLAYQIILHLLLIDYGATESERNRNHWRAEINGFQYQLQNKLTKNLNNHLIDNLENIYIKARKGAAIKTGLERDRFPDTCPYELIKILEESE